MSFLNSFSISFVDLDIILSKSSLVRKIFVLSKSLIQVWLEKQVRLKLAYPSPYNLSVFDCHSDLVTRNVIILNKNNQQIVLELHFYLVDRYSWLEFRQWMTHTSTQCKGTPNIETIIVSIDLRVKWIFLIEALFSSHQNQNPKNFQDSPSHRILRHMYEALNIDKNKN